VGSDERVTDLPGISAYFFLAPTSEFDPAQ
jgi:hypothetical protein